MLLSTFLTLQLMNLLIGASLVDAKPSYLDQKLRDRFSRDLGRVDGGWSDWSLYSLCSVASCTESWVRYCNNPRPANDGITCSGENIRKLECRDNTQCRDSSGEIDSSFEGSLEHKWGPWSECTVTCGVGVRTRTWLPCEGSDCKTQEQPCFNMPCKSLNGYTQWTEWGACVNCHQTRSRSCHFDHQCDEEMQVESQRCNCAMDTALMSGCEIQRETQRNFGGVGYVVTCDETGKYVPRQCDKNVGQCWCVYSASGQEVSGTRHASHTRPYPCDNYANLTTCNALVEVYNLQAFDDTVYKPKCLSDGSFGPMQMNDDIKWCAHKDGLAVKGTISNLEDQLFCDIELTSKTKCEVSPGASCKPSGLFESLQCVQTGSHKLCYCSYSDGQSKQRTESTHPNLPECNVYSDLSLTKCQAEAIHWKVTCLPSGEFASEQCSETVCYCVDGRGEPLHGTEKPAYAQRITSCEELMERRTEPSQMHFSPTLPYTTKGSEIPDTTDPYIISKLKTTFPTPSLPPVTVSSPQVGPDNLEFAPYGEWSEWTECTEECNGGYQTSNRQCPIKGGACGGPDTSTRFSECNMLPCIPVTIDHFEYTWDSTRTILTLVCRAIGLPRAHVAIRADGFVVSDRQDAVDGYTEVVYNTTPTTNTSYTCVATAGDTQARDSLDIVVQSGVVEEFSSSVSALYVGQMAILFCEVSGTPLPKVEILAEGKAILDVTRALPSEVIAVVAPDRTTTYTCVAESQSNFVDDSIELSIVVRDPCEGVVCEADSHCVPEAGGSSCVCDECPDNSTETLLCGSDCVTYTSTCQLSRAICLTGEDIVVIEANSCDKIGQPRITGTSVPKLAKFGDSVTLNCDTLFTTKVTWYNGKVELGSGNTITLANQQQTADYVCKAENCAGSVESTLTVYVQDRGVEECVQYGAGHFHQFSGATFDYPGICHYVLAMDCSKGEFYIYTGTSQCGTVEMPLAYTSSITVFVGREAIVLLRGFDVNEFGVMRHLNPGQEITYKGFRVWRDVELMHLKHKDQNFTITWDGLTGVQLSMSSEYTGRLCGLCGDVGISEPNAVEDVIGHGSTFEVDRYDQCNIASIPTNTCATKTLQKEAEKQCTRTLYNAVLAPCHEKIPVEEFMNACVFDMCGVKWYSEFHSGLCNVASTYAHMCEDIGVDVYGWRDLTPCQFSTMEKVAYLSRRKRRRKRDAGFNPWDIMIHGD